MSRLQKVPMEFTREYFEALVRDAIDDVPAPFAAALAEVPVIVRNRPDPDMGWIYGLYTGIPLDEREGWAPSLPSTIMVFMEPLVRDFPDEETLRSEVRITVLHELGHHLGMTEDDLDRLGYA